MLKTTIQTGPVSIATAGRIAPTNGSPGVFSLGQAEYMSATASSVGGAAWSSGVLTVKVSNRREGPFMALPSTVTLTNAAPVTTVVDVRGYEFATLDVTTAEASVVLDVAVCLYRAN